MSAPYRRWVYILSLLVVVAVGALVVSNFSQESALHILPYGFKKFSPYDPLPRCGRWKEHMPSQRDPVAYRLYIEARKVWRSKLEWELTRDEAMRILADVGKAAEMGDWGARALMAHFYLYGLGVLDSNHVLDAAPEKAVEIQRMAANLRQPWGLYDLGVAYEYGYGGVPYDKELAWAYYLRAAQLGSPEAQMALASAYLEAGRLADEETMQRCAYEQGHGAAAYELAMLARTRKSYKEAIETFQNGVKFGSANCAAALFLLFDYGHWSTSNDEERDALRQIDITSDHERSRRYRAISDALKINPDLKLSRLDSVLPLPPAELPAWSGIEDAVEPESRGPPKY